MAFGTVAYLNPDIFLVGSHFHPESMTIGCRTLKLDDFKNLLKTGITLITMKHHSTPWRIYLSSQCLWLLQKTIRSVLQKEPMSWLTGSALWLMWSRSKVNHIGSQFTTGNKSSFSLLLMSSWLMFPLKYLTTAMILMTELLKVSQVLFQS